MLEIPLSDEDWSRVSHLFTENAAPRPGRPRRAARQVLDAVLWVIVNGEKWHHLPRTFPPPQTCYVKYLTWRKLGFLDEVFRTLEITSPA
ncbi:transposase [Paraburkholderia fungorum]|uniref:transposase n=1 Tax=Paraburkholderia fungorum TaxID=134537 RepID=UPI001C1ED892|nr:transposase [Paraburkholderia fungorum]